MHVGSCRLIIAKRERVKKRRTRPSGESSKVIERRGSVSVSSDICSPERDTPRIFARVASVRISRENHLSRIGGLTDRRRTARIIRSVSSILGDTGQRTRSISIVELARFTVDPMSSRAPIPSFPVYSESLLRNPAAIS